MPTSRSIANDLWASPRGTCSDMTDSELLERFATRRDEASFEMLIRRHGPMVLRVCRQILKNVSDAEDAFQATFLVLVRKAGTVRVENSLSPWLYGVAYRVAARARAAAMRRRGLESRRALKAAGNALSLDACHDLSRALHEEVNRLPAQYRAPIVLCYLEGLTHDEAAARLGLPLGTVKGRLARARELLRSRLSRRGLTISASLLATILSYESASASLPECLVGLTVQTAIDVGPGGLASAGSVSEPVATMIEAALRGLLTVKATFAIVALLLAAAAMVGVALRDSSMLAVAPTTGHAAISPPQAVGTRSEPDRNGSSDSKPNAALQRAAIAPNQTHTGDEPALFMAYRDAKARIRRDPDAHVRLALWCEAHGLDAERLKHLAIAVLIDSSHVTARGLLGQIYYDDRWRTPSEVSRRFSMNSRLSADLAEYNARRARSPHTADAHWKLAIWCEQKGLRPESLAHLTAVTRLDPTHEAAWKRLGCRKHNGRWLTDTQIVSEKAEAEAQQAADRQWGPLLSQWKGLQKSHRSEAERALSGVADPRAVPSILRVFAGGDLDDQARAVQLLGQIDAPSSSRALALMALISRSADVRRHSLETLTRRDPRDVAAFLVSLLRDPDPRLDPDPILYRYELQPVGWQDVGSPGILLVRGPRYNVARIHTVDESLTLMAFGLPVTPYWGYPSRVMAQRQRQFVDLATILEEIVREAWPDLVAAGIQRHQVNAVNTRIMRVLSVATRQDVGEDREAWRKWWAHEQGYAYEPPPPRPRLDLTTSEAKPTFVTSVHLSCFAAGTPVLTLTGRQPIETVKVGDQAVVQETTSGALSIQPVVAVYQNKPSATLRIDLGNDLIIATPIHRFWKAGTGWTMARDLKAGDTIRALGRSVEVDAISAERAQPVFNLEVAKHASFFVGECDVLVHDNSLVRPAQHAFDAEYLSESAERSAIQRGPVTRRPVVK